jgi:hypothetical protein
MASTVYATMRDDFKKILSEWKQSVTITRTTDTTDSLGAVTGTSDTSYTIDAIIQDITAKDRDIHAMGLAEPGNVKIFFKHEYDSDDDSDISTTFTPAVGDKVTDGNSVEYRIETIMHKPKREGYEILIKTVARRLE